MTSPLQSESNASCGSDRQNADHLSRKSKSGLWASSSATRGVLLTFYTFPAEHWMHIRTTNPIESTFATVRVRTKKTKGAGSRLAC